MRIVDAEPQLVKDFIDEIEVTTSKETSSISVHLGRHPTLGKVVVIDNQKGESFIVEVDE